MKDRVSLHPGRVVLTPVPGQTNTYDMTMADQPTQVGDPPTKANLLPDGIVTAFGLPGTNPQVKDGISRLPCHKIQEWTTAGSYTWTAPDLFNGKSYKIGVMVIGGGGSGGAAATYGSSRGAAAQGGASGYGEYGILTVTPGVSYSIVVGAGGAGVTASRTVSGGNGVDGSTGGTSSFNAVLLASGGNGGFASYSSSGSSVSILKSVPGGQIPSAIGSANPIENPFGGVGVAIDTIDMVSAANSCYNPFEYKKILGAGGSGRHYVATDSNGNIEHAGGKDPVTGLGGSDFKFAVLTYTGTVNGLAPTAPGCGSGGVAVLSLSYSVTAISAAGADGAVMIYVMGVEA